jgi:ethanolamine utilization protein EutQ (cupin superfamily)
MSSKKRALPAFTTVDDIAVMLIGSTHLSHDDRTISDPKIYIVVQIVLSAKY